MHINSCGLWCGAVRCGAVRCGAVRCGAVRGGARRCEAVRGGAAFHSFLLFFCLFLFFDMLRLVVFVAVMLPVKL